MRIIIRIFPVLLLFSLALCGADAPLFHVEYPDNPPAAEATGTFQSIAAHGIRNDRATPAGMLAARIGENNRQFVWVPSRNTASAASEADLMDAVVSADESLMVIAERVGGAEKINNTRIILVNLYSGNICGGFELPLRRIVRLALIPDAPDKLAAIQLGDSNTGSTNAIVIIDLAARKVAAESSTLPESVHTLTVSGGQLYFAMKNRSEFHTLPIADLHKPYLTTICKAPVVQIVTNPVRNTIQIVENGFCEFFRVTRQGAMLENSIATADIVNPQWVLSLPSESEALIIAGKRGELWSVSGNLMRKIAENCGANSCISPGGNELFVESAIKGKLMRYALPEFSTLPGIYPRSLRPANKNATFRLFPRTGVPVELIQLDVRGNIFKIFVSGRRGHKLPLLLTDKRGIK